MPKIGRDPRSPKSQRLVRCENPRLTSAVEASIDESNRYAGRNRQRNPATEDLEQHPKAGWLAMKYLVIFEKGAENWGAYAPDLPGYAATASVLDELRKLVREGIPFHVGSKIGGPACS